MRKIIIGLMVLIFVNVCFAQNEKEKQSYPDFSGKWKLDKSKSDTGLNNGPIRFSVKLEFPDTTLVIVQSESEIKVTETRKSNDGNKTVEELIYKTDGENSIADGNQNSEAKPTAKWEGQKFIITSFIPVPAIRINNRASRMETTEVWELSNDGKILTQTITFKTEANLPGPAPMIKVFKRS